VSDAAFHAAISQEVVWKDDEIKTFAVALVKRALASGRPHFTTDIVPDSERGTGRGIAGSVIELLKNANVIQPVGHTSDGQWFALRVKSTRPDRKSAWISVYQLTNQGMAREFLTRHGAGSAIPLKQQEFFAAEDRPCGTQFAMGETPAQPQQRIETHADEHPIASL
jgi:hypothetical protein